MKISTGDISLAIVVVVCIVWALRFLLTAKKTAQAIEAEDEMPGDKDNLVGTSKTRLGQYADNEARKNTNNRKLVPSDELEEVFYTREEAELNIDVDMEPLTTQDGEMDEEDFLLFDEMESIPVLAMGASFDELSEMSDALQSHLHDLSEAHIKRAAKTVRTMENTNLMEQLLTQINSGEQKVADILDLCDAELSGQIAPETCVDDLGGFDLGEYL